MENVNQIFSKGHLSTRLLDSLYEPVLISEDDSYSQIMAIFILLNAISKMGWIEHTSDWDLSAIIKTRDNQTIEIPQGYADSLTLHNHEGKPINLNDPDYFSNDDTKEFTLQLEETALNTDDEDLKPISIKFSNILTIQIFP